MQKLDLALDIAQTIAEAGQKGDAIDVGSKAKQLSEAHPESSSSSEEIAEVLHDESQAAGVGTGHVA